MSSIDNIKPTLYNEIIEKENEINKISNYLQLLIGLKKDLQEKINKIEGGVTDEEKTILNDIEKTFPGVYFNKFEELLYEFPKTQRETFFSDYSNGTCKCSRENILKKYFDK